MKKIYVLLFVAFGINNMVYSQEKSELSKKEQSKIDKNEKFLVVHELMNSKLWMFKIESITTISGEVFHLENDANYIICEENIATFQIPAKEFVRMGQTKFIGLSELTDITSYALDDFSNNNNIKGRIRVMSDPFPWIKLNFSVDSENNAMVEYIQSDGVNFTLSGVMKPLE
ncbi:MAG: hypothetical protein ACPGRC_02110 [Salibacteraceae bacterium]